MLKKYGFWILLLLLPLFFIAKKAYMSPKYVNGAMAPDFTATTLSGKTVSLSELRGTYVLLDFWGSWCAPCRAEVPQLKALYDKYHRANFADADGFEIVSIALEKAGTETRWQQAIRQLHLDWEYHVFDAVSNFRFLDADISTKIYGVKEVPTKYLLNPDGYIMGVNLSFEKMDKLLQKRVR